MWLPEILEQQRREYIELYGIDFGNAIWRQEFYCDFNAPVLGAIYSLELTRAERGGQICRVEFDPRYPVFTAWDLGYTDDTAIWWFQVVAGEVRLLEYYESHGKAPEHYASQILGRNVVIDIVGNEVVCRLGDPIADLQHRRLYRYQTHFFPHDARAKTLAAKGKSLIEQMAKALGMAKLQIAPELSIQDGIQAARLMFPRCYFDAARTENGLEALRNYQREWDDNKREFRHKPRHDWTSHGADAFRILAVAWHDSGAIVKQQPPIASGSLVVGPNPGGATMNDMWAEHERRLLSQRDRI